MEPVGVGVIGLGFMGRTHLAAYRAAGAAAFPCRVVAVADVAPKPGAGPAGNLATGADAPGIDPAAAVYRDPAGLLADSAVGLVSICTYTDTHVDLAMAALAAGKHVLVEKPVAVTAEGVARLRDAAAGAGTLCMPAMCMRFWPAWVWLKERVADGTLGAVRSAVFHRLGSVPAWSAFYADTARSGGALVDLHIHDADFVTHLFGAPAEVFSAGSIDHATTAYRFARGPEHVVAEGGWGHAPGLGFRMRFVVCFEGGTADFDVGREPQLLLCRGEGREPVVVPSHSGYDGEVRAMIAAIGAGAASPPVTMDDALLTARVLDAERESLRRGRPVGL